MRARADEPVSRGVQLDDLVTFARPNGPEFLVPVFGSDRVREIPALLSPSLPAHVAAASKAKSPRSTTLQSTPLRHDAGKFRKTGRTVP